MGRIGIEKFYICVAIPQFICSLILVILAFGAASLDWDQDVLDYVITQWKTKVMEDVVFIDEDYSCSSGYSQASYKWPGTNTGCDVTEGSDKGKFKIRTCGKVSTKVTTTKNGKTTTKTKKVTEGKKVSGWDVKYLKNYMDA